MAEFRTSRRSILIKNQIKMARKAEKTDKPKRTYKKRVKVEAIVEKKAPYNWRKHLKKTEPVEESVVKDVFASPDHVIAELETWINRFPDALFQLKIEAGEIQSEDVMYHLQLICRILRNKYSTK